MCAPVDDPVALLKFYLDEWATPRPTQAAPAGRIEQGTVAAAHQMVAGQVEEMVGPPVHFHGDVAATVQVGPDLTTVPHREGAAGPALVAHVEGAGLAAVGQVAGVAQGVPIGAGRRHGCQHYPKTGGPGGNLSSALRLYVLEELKKRAEANFSRA